jgi:HEAT repeat protein
VQLLGDKDICYDAELALISIGPSAYNSVLGELYSNTASLNVRHSCARIISKSVDAEVGQRLINDSESKENRIRKWSTFALGITQVENKKAALIKRLKDDEPSIREMAVIGLIKMSCRDVYPEICELSSDQDPGVRKSCAEYFSTVSIKESEGNLEKLVNDPDPGVSTQAILSMVRINSDSWIEFALKCIESSIHPEPRRTCIYAIGALRMKDHLPILYDILRDECKHTQDRIWAAFSIYNTCNDPLGLEYLKSIIGRGTGGFHSEKAVKALGYIDNEKTYSLLIEALKSESHFLRAYSLEAITNSKFRKKAIPSLVDLLESLIRSINSEKDDMHDGWLALAARKTLISITGVDHKYFYKDWAKLIDKK